MQSIALNKGSELLVLVTNLALTETSGSIDGPNMFPFYYVHLAERSPHEPVIVLRKINFWCCFTYPHRMPKLHLLAACFLPVHCLNYSLTLKMEAKKESPRPHGKEG